MVRSPVPRVTTLLYYAGMAADRQTEQIGLAVSNGDAFERVEGDGLIIARDPSLAWKSLRVCNPTVISWQGSWLMFYQGVGPGPGDTAVHAIAAARSADCIHWTCDEQPLLTFDHVRAVFPRFATAAVGGVLEPAIVGAADSLTMYFVAYVGSYRDGSYLLRATSVDGRCWSIDRDWLLPSTQFGRFRLHYPEVVTGPSGDALWFSLFDLHTGSAAIFRMSSIDGAHFERLHQVLPAAATPPSVRHREVLSLSINGTALRGLSRFNHAVNATVWHGRNYLGFAHSHLESNDRGQRMYYHAYHLDARGRVWMDIGRCLLDGDRVTGHTTVFTPSRSVDAWDAFFVADPFVVTPSTVGMS